ncbi:MAG: threonine--tRNA ligase [Acidobacteria bacterium 13_1_40CM_2_56_5]|nr:MAG: threonine--tRNA ligase [Acidobacteria bacterium 13_1_40CM_2_56_5]
MPKNEKLDTKRHSLAHVMAASIQELFPEAKFGVGPVIEDGFYYDVYVNRPMTPEDLQAIEKRMREKVKQNLRFERSEMPTDAAITMFELFSQSFKVELLQDLKTRGTTAVADLDDANLVGGSVSEVSVYRTGEFTDLCRGPHVTSTSEIDPESFRLTRVSGAYWRGNQAREQMQRVYGVAFDTKKELEDYFVRLEEARKRDHRKLGRELGLFTFHQWAPGAAFWLAKGTTLYNTLANYMREILFPAGYVEVKTPLIYNKALWERSGHWKHYRKNMFLIESEGETMSMKPMNCPGHFLAYASEVRSYRDLPIRFHEQTPLHRNEASGVLSGLTRVRQFSQDDAHCFLMQEQIGEEIERLIRLIQRIYGDFGLSFSAKLSTRPDEFLGEIATWDHAETQLKAALDNAKMAYTLNEKDGAFYGPKIDFDITDAIGRNWQCATIQLDYEQPQNFDLKYIGADNTEHRPVLIHRAIFGSFERFIAILIEHYAGAFPLWLAPVQAVMIPIADRHVEYCRQVRDRLNAAGLRVDIDSSLERMNAKIRNAQLQKIPYMLVVGDREQEQGAVSVRLRSGEDLKSKPLDEFLAMAKEAVASKK